MTLRSSPALTMLTPSTISAGIAGASAGSALGSGSPIIADHPSPKRLARIELFRTLTLRAWDGCKPPSSGPRVGRCHGMMLEQCVRIRIGFVGTTQAAATVAGTGSCRIRSLSGFIDSARASGIPVTQHRH